MMIEVNGITEPHETANGDVPIRADAMSADYRVLSRWHELLDQYPALAELETTVRALRVSDDDPTFWHRYEEWKARLNQILGYGRDRDTAHDVLLLVFERGAIR
jgi:hypothetical protein